jgi:peptide/nickel transport system permease protein
MSRYIARRLILNVVVIWLVATFVFITVRALPGDFAVQTAGSRGELVDQTQNIKQLRKDLGLDKPLWRQYVGFIGGLAILNFGKSYETRHSTWSEIGTRLPYTLELGFSILLIAFAVSLPVGIISAVRQDSWIDNALRGFAILALAVPVFFSAVIALFFVLRFHLWKVDLITYPHYWTNPGAALRLYAIPALAGGIAGGAGIMRLLRSQLLEVLRQDYVRTAFAKGLRERSVVLRHALKNAMLPVLTVMGLAIADIISGQIILENMFNIHGIGQYLLSRLLVRDFPPFQGVVILAAIVVVTINLVVDVLYAWLDPRIRLA